MWPPIQSIVRELQTIAELSIVAANNTRVPPLENLYAGPWL
jgi:hypothetical protein